MTDCNINKILRTKIRNLSRGAPMGDTDCVEGPLTNLRCQRVYLVDGDYGPDGTYWGASTKHGHIYCAFNDGGDGDDWAPACGVRIYVRAFTYEQAKRVVAERYPGATFARGGR
jgi:hypothetical protein